MPRSAASRTCTMRSLAPLQMDKRHSTRAPGQVGTRSNCCCTRGPTGSRVGQGCQGTLLLPTTEAAPPVRSAHLTMHLVSWSWPAATKALRHRSWLPCTEVGSPGAVCTPCPAVSVGRVISAPVVPVLARSHADIPAIQRSSTSSATTALEVCRIRRPPCAESCRGDWGSAEATAPDHRGGAAHARRRYVAPLHVFKMRCCHVMQCSLWHLACP